MSDALLSSCSIRSANPGISTDWTPSMRAQALIDLAHVIDNHPGLAGLVTTADRNADLQDFWEDIARAAAAVKAAKATSRTLELREADQWSRKQLANRLGPVALNENGQRHCDDPLLMDPLLMRFGGRWLSMAGYSDEPGELPADHDLIELLLSRARLGVPRVVIKFAVAKTGIFAVDLHASMTAPMVHEAVLEAAGEDCVWSLLGSAGQHNTLLVQDWIEMTYEYRLFVVDGRIVTGAGCLEELTPYDRRDTRVVFDTRMQRIRDTPVMGDKRAAQIEDRADLLERYLSWAMPLARESRRTFVLDLALRAADNLPVVVELNALPNSGLYASDVTRLFCTLANAKDKGYSDRARIADGQARA